MFPLLNSCKKDEPVMANFEFVLSDEGRVTFKNTSLNGNSFEWDFGNGTKSTEMSPNIQYAKNGAYSVVLTAKGSKSQDTKIQTVTVTAAPKAVVKFSYKSLGNGLIEFTNETLNADTYKWTFGNGDQSTEKSPKAQYQVNGTYEVRLEAINFNGTAEAKQNITIADAPKPVADFSLNYGGNGTVSFSNLSRNADSYQWTFGNGQTSTNADPSVAYSANGTYTVTLTAKNKNGENTISKTISVSNIFVPTTGDVVFWINFNSSLKIYVNNTYRGLTTKYIIGSTPPSCGREGFVTVTLPQGAYSFTAEEDKLFGSKWAGTINVVNGQCRSQQLIK